MSAAQAFFQAPLVTVKGDDMASLYVRQTVRTWLQDPTMSVPFYNTTNEEQSPNDAIWSTIDFSFADREIMTFCGGDVSEEGEFEVVYLGQPGIGDVALLTAAEADIKTLMAQRDPTNKLILTSRSAPDEFTQGDAKLEYGVSFFVNYTYYE